MKNYYEHELIPDAHLLLSSLRSVGYTEETAIADIIDNCISAGANEIRLNFDWENQRIVIVDNGSGMNENELFEAMKIGSSDPNICRSVDDLGRFGMGMKTAAFSLGKRLVVVSKDGYASNACWDLDKIEKDRVWKIIIKDKEDKIISYAIDQINDYNSGTVIIVDRLDRIIDESNIKKSESKFYKIINKIRKHISIVFHRFIEEDNIDIYINDNLITAWNPFILNNKATQELGLESFYNNGKYITIEPFILPHKTKFETEELFREAGGFKGWLQHQGFYIYRNRRLLVYGTWFNILKKEPSFNLARIKVDIESDSDFDWQIDIKKSKAVPPVYIEELIKKVANICTEKSSNVYNSRGSYTKSINMNIPNLKYVWEQRKNSQGRYSFYLNKKHPLLFNIKKDITKEGQLNLDAYLSLVENFSPVMMSGVTEYISNKNIDTEKLEVEKDLIHIQRLIEIFRANEFSDDEIFDTISTMSSYRHLDEDIKFLIKGIEVYG